MVYINFATKKILIGQFWKSNFRGYIFRYTKYVINSAHDILETIDKREQQENNISSSTHH